MKNCIVIMEEITIARNSCINANLCYTLVQWRDLVFLNQQNRRRNEMMEKFAAVPDTPVDGSVRDWVSFVLEWICWIFTFQWVGLIF